MQKLRSYLSIALTSILIFTGCNNSNTPDDYYYKEYAEYNGIGIEFYGKGYGDYGQLLRSAYCTGSIESIFDPDDFLTITTSTNDNSSASTNEIFLTLTINGNCSDLVTSFSTDVQRQINSFRISYKNDKDEDVYLSSSYSENQIFNINTYVSTITLYVQQNKYFPTYYEIEELQGELAHNKFTIKQFSLNF